jgi:hypothetical protein
MAVFMVAPWLEKPFAFRQCAVPCWLARSSSVGKPKWVITWRPSGV